MRGLFGRLPFGHRSGGATPLSPASGSQPCRALLTIAGDLLFVIGFPLAVWLALVVTP